MIIVALSVVVLLGALALAVDWGYGLTQRRVMQTSSDAAALGVGRYLATSVIEVDGNTAFSVTEADAWCEAERFVQANDAFRPADAIVSFTVQLGDGTEPIGWTEIAAPAGGCPAAGSAPVPAGTRYVRVATTITYRSLIAGVLGFPTTTAAASARARLSGTPVPTIGPIWPMVRHYDRADFSNDDACPPSSCDPTTIGPMTFWSPNEDDVVYGSFKGLVDFSRNSSRLDPTAPQLIAEWDQSGSASAQPPTPLKPDTSGNCGGFWDTAGGEAPQLHGKQCSIPNWFFYQFEGSPSLSSGWIADTPEGQEAPSVLTAERAVCEASERPDPAPSCDDPTVGDWIETAFGDIGTNMSDNMKALVQTQGFIGPYSDRIIEHGPNRGEPYGKALVVLVYLWDCAETFNSSAPEGRQWELIVSGQGGGDCSRVPRTGNAPTPDRVHLLTAAPFTFYEGLVSSQAIQGYWGGAFGDPRECDEWEEGMPVCELNPLANTAVLVADDGP